MSNNQSVAQARRNLSELLRQVEAGEVIEITRRGEPVAVLVSIEEYQRTQATPSAFRLAFEQWQRSWTESDRVDEGYFDGLRDRSPTREVDL